jgi:hypothetical protein
LNRALKVAHERGLIKQLDDAEDAVRLCVPGEED